MSKNQHTIQQYMQGFREGDHQKILNCLTDDVEWELPGLFHLHGKNAFEKEIENEAFEGRPQITISRIIEADEVVVAEGSVLTQKRAGEVVKLVFCDVFEMQNAKIRKLISYLMEIK